MVRTIKMWEWANDEKIVEKFKNLNALELAFLSVFVCLYSIDTSLWGFSEIWIAVFSILLISKTKTAFSIFTLPDVYCKVFLQIDKRVYFLFLISLGVSLFVFLFFPDSWPGISNSIEVMAFGIPPYTAIYNIVKEEALYRFLLYYSLNALLGRHFAFFGAVTMFSLMHHPNNFYYPFAVAPAGILFSIVSLASGSIVAPALLHFIFNISIFIFVTYIF